jgi:hypothetical protein
MKTDKAKEIEGIRQVMLEGRKHGFLEGYAKALQGLDKLGMRIKGELLEAGKHNTDTSRTICLILNSILQDIEELQKLKPKAEEKESEQ